MSDETMSMLDDRIAELEDENAALQRENAALRADKERLDSGRIRLKFHVRCDVWKVVDCDNVDLRDAIDAAMKEAQP